MWIVEDDAAIDNGSSERANIRAAGVIGYVDTSMSCYRTGEHPIELGSARSTI